MLHAELVNQNGSVGVAPSTSMLTLSTKNGRSGGPNGHARRRYSPYADIASLKGSAAGGLGIIYPGDWWQTGRPYGLPGTTVIRVGPDGSTSLEGAGFGADDPATVLPPENIRQYVDTVRQQERKRTYVIGAIAGGLGLLGFIVALARR